MVDNFGINDLGMFKTTAGWQVLTEEQRSLFEAFLRRSETWTLAHVLNYMGANVDLPTITPAIPPVVTMTAHAISSADVLPPLNTHNLVPVVIPPTGEELAELRKRWDRDWKHKQARASDSDEESGEDVSITLTQEEIRRVTLRAKQQSRELSGHGRKPHGGYASSSSAATLAADQERSEKVAIQKALAAALRRKRKGGTA